MGIPTLLDISPTNLLFLDERTAYTHFFGKSKIEAQALFGQADFYADDLGWMGENAFAFYVDAYVNHLASCNPLELEMATPMTIVMLRNLDKNKNHENTLKLINKIADLRGISPPTDKSIERKYDQIVKEILEQRSREI